MILGTRIGILCGLLWLGSFANVCRAPRGDTFFVLILLALHLDIAIALLFFWRRKSSAT
jgi:hypothetical protein